jgi:hypothetical protein
VVAPAVARGESADVSNDPAELFAKDGLAQRYGAVKAQRVPQDRLEDMEQDWLQMESVPFRQSKSIQERCRTKPVPTPESCKKAMELLEEMSREERDPEWATRAEARIRAVVFARQDGTQIRALECKTSLCAIEAVSPGSEHLVIFRQAEQESAGIIDDGDFVLAWEEDPMHGRVTITGRIYSRRVQ